VQTAAKRSQEKHELLIEASKETEDVRRQEEEAFKNFIDSKMKFNEVNEELKKRLFELQELMQKESTHKQQSRETSQRRKKTTLEQKKMSVEEKIKKGMKLTTEDLIAFQGVE
jgi:uncharacterized coiled-coil DUF342 family protein